MKAKNILLGVLAFSIGISAAFASMRTYRAAWISVLYFGSEQYICVDTGFQCDEFGPFTCKITVETISGPLVVPARRDIGCVSILSENSSDPIGTYFPPSELLLSAE